MSAKFLNKNIFIVLAALAVAVAGGFAGLYFSGGYSLGKNPQNEVSISNISEPQPTDYSNSEKISPSPLYVTFSSAAASLDKIGVPLQSGISIQPDIRGVWQWNSDNYLVFTPETDWLPDTSYKVILNSSIFSPQIKIKDSSFRFNSPAFKGFATAADFYENPQDLKNKAVTGSFKFTYPLDTEDLKQNIKIRTVSGDNYDFNYKLDEHNTVLHIISSPVHIKEEEDFAKINLSHLSNAYNHKSLKQTLESTVKIPSNSAFFKLSGVTSSIVKNNQHDGNPEQILTINFTTAVNNKQLQKALTLKFSPQNCYLFNQQLAKQNNISEFASKLQTLIVEEVSTQFVDSKTHLFKYDMAQNSGCLLALFDNKLNSAEGFKLGKDNTYTYTTTSLTPYPLEADIAFDGAIMSLQGSRKAAFVSRGAKELNIDIARIKEADLNHLVTQTYGNFARPDFTNYNFNEDNIAEIFHKNLPINTANPAEADYSSLDLNEYVQNRKGVFLLTLQGKNGERESYPNKRLLIMTNLGIVVKDNLNKTHDVFVSDINSETPVAGALVQVLGKNGLPVLSARTNEKGLAKIGDFSDFKKDKQAVVYKVSLADDISFLPIERDDRLLNMSRFDVGGEYSDSGYTYTPQSSLKGYIFSDRGIYRPNESGNLGIVLRQSDLAAPQQLPLELTIRKPNGDVLANKKLQSDKFGFMEYQFQLGANAPVGTYSIDLWLKDKNNQDRFVAYSDFKVAEFTPDTLKIKAEWQPVISEGWFNGKSLQALIDLQNLYGAPAAQHTLQADYNLVPASFKFAKYKDFTFKNPLQTQKVRAYNDNLPETKTDKDGKASIDIDLSSFEQGTYNLYLQINGFEAGSARGVSTGLSALVSPAEYLIGWKTDGDLNYIAKNTERKIEFIAIDNKLQPLDKSNLILTFARKEYAPSLVEQKNGTYEYQMTAHEQNISQTPLSIGSGGKSELLLTAEAGDYSLSISDENGTILAKIDYSVAGETNLKFSADKDARLELKLDKSEYAAGENIAMQITAPYSGYGLITIERDNVYAYKWFKSHTTSVSEQITLPKDIEGNAYVNVAFFRSLQSPEIYTPAMSYAAAAFNINKSNRRLDIELNTPEIVKPGDDLVIGYKTSEPANIVIYGVNEGILQVANYKTPNLLNIFLNKKALQVYTYQIMDLIMPDISFLRRLSSVGGDGGDDEEMLNLNLNPFARKTDKPVAFWSGILDTQNSSGNYTYHVPETFNGNLRVMAEAVSEARFGSAEKSVLARGDFALTPSGPYNAAPNDEFVIGLSVGNLLEQPAKIKFSLDADNGLEILSEKEQTLDLAANSEALLKFRLKAGQSLGSKTLTFKAVNQLDANQHAVMPYTLSIRPAVPFSTKFDMGLAKNEYTLKKADDLYAEYRLQQLSASVSPLVLAQGLLQYLDKYPHYCTEQTISKVFPTVELFFKSPELVKNIDVYALFDDAVRILRERQTISGGFTAWSNNGLEVDTRDSLYAAHFLVLAKQHGFNVPENLLDSALEYSATIAAQQPENLDDIAPAYAAYILTLSGKTTTNYWLNLEEFFKANYAKEWQQSLNAEFLASGYILLQDAKRALSLAGQYKNTQNPVDNAVNIYLLATHFPEKLKTLNKESLETLLEPLKNANFATYSASWSVLALNAFNNFTDDKNIKFSEFETFYNPFPTVAYTPQTKDLTVSAAKPFYYVNNQQGFSKNATFSPMANGLEVSKTYYDKNDQTVSSAKLGDVLTVKVNYRSLGKDPINDVAFVDLLAGCFEVVDNSLTLDDDTYSYEIREDRVNVYATAFVSKHSFSYKVKVVAEGTFSLPPVYGSAMYQPLVRANSALSKISVGE